DCRPPPGRRTRPRGTGSGPTSSRCPWVMVVRLIPVITENSVVPPCPFIDARRPTTRRACFSSRPAIARHTFRCSVASALRGWTLHASQPQVALLLAMPAGDHAPIHASSVQVIEFHLLGLRRVGLRQGDLQRVGLRRRALLGIALLRIAVQRRALLGIALLRI